VSRRQLAQAVAAALASWALLLGYALIEGVGARNRFYMWQGGAGFLAAILTVAYIIFLRVQKAPLTIGAMTISWLGRELPRTPTSVRLLRWRHLIHDGTILELAYPEGPLRLGVSHRLAPPALLSPWSPDGDVDAILSPADFSDVVDALGVAHLGWTPPGHRTDGPLATWLATIGVLTAFGLALGFSGLGERLTRTVPGRASLSTVACACIALAFVLTFTRGTRSASTRATVRATAAAAPEKQAPFWHSVGLVLSAQLVSAMLAMLYLGPVLLTTHAFDRWVDTPACAADCQARGEPFTSFRSTKQGSFCSCGPNEHHASYTITGGTSFGARLFDWFVRASAIVASVAVLPLLLAATFFLSRWFRRRAPS
jgi:hypothetical protein